MTDPSTRRHTGRRPGRSGARDCILTSARRSFAARGFERTSIRTVAEEAGVDPALVMHYFSSKDGLFRASIDCPVDLEAVSARIMAVREDARGRQIVRVICEVWQDETTRHPLVILLRNAIERQDAAALLSQFVERELVGRLSAQTRGEDASARASAAYSALLGLVLARYVIGVEPLASAPLEQVVELVGPTIQRYLDGGG
jgi:AcrR family transcriptional regulator